jgi:arylsulfatase A-like enzyme
MLRKIFLVFIGLTIILNIALFINQQTLQKKIKEKPNVILISVDALRADHVGAYGYRENTTPHLDELARKGTLFHNHIADASWTLPSHAAMLTSQYSHVIGVEKIDQSIPKSTVTLPEVLKNYGYNTKGIISFAFVEPMYGFEQGFDEYDTSNSYFNGEYRDKWYKSSPDITDKAISWITKNKDKRFFLFLHYFDVHEAYNPPPPFDKLFNASENEIVNAYDGEIAYTDYHLGRLFSQLSALDLTDNTLIIVTSDHGDAFMEHGVYGHEPTVYEEIIQTPLIVSLPARIPEAKAVFQQTQSIDVAPTVLDILGFPIPREFNGETLLPLILGKGTPKGREYTFSRVISQWYHKETVRTPKYKLIHVYEPLNASLDNTTRVHSYELYDLEQDSGEKKNLIAERPDVVSELKTVLDVWLSRGKDANVTVQPVELSEAAKKRLESLGYL